MTLFQQTIHDLHQMLIDRKISSMELTEAVLTQIDAVGEQTKAYLLVTREQALRQAKAADERLKAKRDVTPLTGIPIALKDVLCVKDVVSTAGSKILTGFVPPYSATVVERLDQAGAVFLGKTNCDEFAMGSSNENSGYWPVHNPWALDRVPGGSSGGSAAAVASGEAIAALGSDTGGSIRQPAALTGIVGMKPTYGRVSRYGLIAFASSLDQIGPMTRDVTDAAILLQAIAGHDSRDSTSSSHQVPDYRATLHDGVKGMRLGVPKEYFVAGMEPAVEQAVRDAMRLFEQ
ncbi:MAG TPA: amidase family protein, partial [Candidatus Dormibacteraeota bacterium]|nr:amidase family protein [Candidatus Dormibacteraeota bacterium]